jgi:hypothetical protein
MKTTKTTLEIIGLVVIVGVVAAAMPSLIRYLRISTM